MGLGTSKLEKAIVSEFPEGQNFYGFENVHIIFEHFVTT